MKNQPALPNVINNYIAATNSSDMEKFLAGFKKDAVVTDESRIYIGIKRIEEWRTKSIADFYFGLELTNVKFEGDEIVVGTNCTGNFPGSPVLLKHRFNIENKLIIALSITG